MTKIIIPALIVFSMLLPQRLSAAMGEDLLFMDLDVVTASKVSEKAADAAGVITVITKDELKRFGGTTLADILRRVPSINDATPYMSDRTLIAIRGAQTLGTNGHVLFLINGRPVREELEGGCNTELIEAF
ncbi:MAG: Plug domain-containing protein, partial [Elusimicrobia bacterium]|nr:Plug domain-containing protein [Elusimicrobiota bacterium]